MKVLNLYAGIGGNRKLWKDVKVTAVENDKETAKVYRHYFPKDTLIIGDAHEYLRENFQNFDFIWSSPPCPSHSRANFWANAADNRNKPFPSMMLYEEVLFLKHYCKTKWLVENVIPYYEPLIVAKKVGRHLFWSNFVINEFKESWLFKGFDRCSDLEPAFGYDLSNYKLSNKLKNLRNCVHPETGEHILNLARGIIKSNNTKQTTLF